jgi:hypothetical protein
MDTPIVTNALSHTVSSPSTDDVTTTATPASTIDSVGSPMVDTPPVLPEAGAAAMREWVRSIRRIKAVRASLRRIGASSASYLLNHLSDPPSGASPLPFEDMQTLLTSATFRRHLVDVIAALPKDPNPIPETSSHAFISVGGAPATASTTSAGAGVSSSSGVAIQPNDIIRYIRAAIMIAKYPDHILSRFDDMTDTSTRDTLQSLAEACLHSAKLLISRLCALLRCVAALNSPSDGINTSLGGGNTSYAGSNNRDLR